MENEVPPSKDAQMNPIAATKPPKSNLTVMISSTGELDNKGGVVEQEPGCTRRFAFEDLENLTRVGPLAVLRDHARARLS